MFSTDAFALSCGDVITSSTTLTSDLDCSGLGSGDDALTITGNGVVFDGAGFSVIADNADSVIRITGDDVVVSNVTVSGSSGDGRGIEIYSADNLSLVNVTSNGRRYGVYSAGSNAGLSVTNCSFSSNTDFALYLRGLHDGLSFAGNSLSNNNSGLRIRGAVGPISLVGGTNSFSANGVNYTDELLYIEDSSEVSVTGFDLSANPGATGVRVDDSVDVVIESNVLTGLARGVYATGTGNMGLQIQSNNLGSNTEYGVDLDGCGGDLVLDSNDFTASRTAVRLRDFFGPWELPASNTFASNATATYQSAVWLSDAYDVGVVGLDLSGSGLGTAVRLQDCVRCTVDSVDASDRYDAITADDGVLSKDLTLVNNTVNNAASWGFRFDDLDSSLVFEGNTINNARRGVRVDGHEGPWSLSPTNVFTDVGDFLFDPAVLIEHSSNITLDGLDLSASTSGGYGVRIRSVDGITVRNSDLSGHFYGVYATGPSTANTDMVVRDNDLSDEGLWGAYLQSVEPNLYVTGNVYDGSRNGLRLNQITGPATVDMSSSSLGVLGDILWNSVVWTQDSTDIDFVGLELHDNNLMYGWSIRDSNNITVSDSIVCGMQRGVDVRGTSNLTVVNSSFGSGFDGVWMDLDPGYHVDIAALFLGNVGNDIDQNGLGTYSSTVGLMSDADADGTSDYCDPCPNDPSIGFGDVGVCSPVGCAGTGPDIDGDGWCASLDCDDFNDNVFPNNVEICDGIDNDCLFGVDQGQPWKDADGDHCGDCEYGSEDASDDGDDFDGDGLCDYGDDDDDNDGVVDSDDIAPHDPTRCEDSDGDGCDDCSVVNPADPNNDGVDTDGDGACDGVDPDVLPTVLLDTTDVAWSTGGVGAPSVIYDTLAGHYLMVFETQTGTSAECPFGTWSIGAATSPDGLTWTDLGGPLVSPATSTYYGCAAAHPSIVQHDGTTVLFFKAEQENTCDVGSPPSWGCDRFTGVGRVNLSWTGATYALTGPDSVPVLNIDQNFGFPRVVFDDRISQYRMAFSIKPDVFVARGTASDLRVVGAATFTPGIGPWAPDELFNPAVLCEDDGSVSMYLGGRDLNDVDLKTIEDQSMGLQLSNNWAMWTDGAAPIFSVVAGDTQMRHWDVLRVGTDDLLVFYDDQDGPGGSNQVRLASTVPTWASADVRPKICY